MLTMNCRLCRLLLLFVSMGSLSGCGSIISRTVAGQGHNHQFYPGVQWDLRDSGWKYVTALDVPFSLLADTLMLPVDLRHGPYP
jgi:uncharacterized protein YceK